VRAQALEGGVQLGDVLLQRQQGQLRGAAGPQRVAQLAQRLDVAVHLGRVGG
jgi:hypothetical protein